MSTANTRRLNRSVSARSSRSLRASWNTTIPLKHAQVHPSDSRGYIVDSNFLIPRVRDLESEFQRELGKCLFERTVQFAEEGLTLKRTSANDNNNNAKNKLSVSADDLSAFSAGGVADRESLRFFDSRRYLNVKPTRCTSALVQKDERFDTYFISGSLNKYAVANARGPVDSTPRPAIEKDVYRVQSANKNNLRPFSVRECFTDKEKDTAPEEYWKQKAIEEKERLEAEEKARKEAEEQARLEAIEREKREREEEKARLIAEEKARKEAEALLAIARAETEAIKTQLAEVEKARDEVLLKFETLSTTTSTKSKGKSKKGKGKSGNGKGKKGRSSDDNSYVSSVSKKRAGKAILKNNDDNSSTGDEKGKRVTFKEKLTSTKTISPRGERTKSPRRASSPSGGKKKNFPGSSRSKSGNAKVKGKKKKKKKSPEPPPVVEVAPEPVVVEEPPPEENLEDKLPRKPKPIVLDEPPMFVLATEYKTKQQMVEEWLYLRSCSACPTSMPLA